jgi:hypothetical protein
VAYITVYTGDPIPEAKAWPNLKSWIRQKFIKWDERQNCYVALKKQVIKRAEPVVQIEETEEVQEETEENFVVEFENIVEPKKQKRRGRPRKKKVDLYK